MFLETVIWFFTW